MSDNDLFKKTLSENELKRTRQLLEMGISPITVAVSHLSVMHPLDHQLFRQISIQGYLIVVRCPKASSWALQGVLPPKPWAVKEKTGKDGTVLSKGIRFVSDYDLMCVWYKAGNKLNKLFISAKDGADCGEWSSEAKVFYVQLNQQLRARIQHGCQDDYVSEKNPGVKIEDCYAAFYNGKFDFLPNMDAAKRYYEKLGLEWLYNNVGVFDLKKARNTS
jgi:hypothetical protein